MKIYWTTINLQRNLGIDIKTKSEKKKRYNMSM